MPGLTTSPPFPEDVPTHPLLIIDYELIRQGDETEINRLWKAATELGFWYLKNHGVEEEVEEMFDMGRETLDLPLEEKSKFEQGNQGFSFGYKGAGVQFIDDKGARDVTEFLNIAKDDALAWPASVHRTYPSTVNARMESTIKPFVQKSLSINHFLIDILNDRLGLPEGTGRTQRMHCAGHSRSPLVDFDKVFLTAHTDYGSLSFLHNRLGGLQVLPPGSDKWFYIKPLPGHAICNIGDALNIFSGGILRSNIHRVVPPPKTQAQYERWSLVFFTRPNDTVELRHQADKSAMIADAIAKATPGKYEPGATAQEWLARRIRSRRVTNFKGAESWEAHKGTEDTPIPYV
ncbi:Clavaminate synthase-like protein [Fomes fomentarius]|nr:Clavaminate synthase-like protein [Fomes fomentarius]